MDDKVAVIGGGSWATAMVKMLGDNLAGKHIYWWMRNTDTAAYIQAYGHNPKYLSAAALDLGKITVTGTCEDAVKDAGLVVLNVPAAFLRQTLADLPPQALQGKLVVSAIKGVVPGVNKIVGAYLHEDWGVPMEDILVVTGPCHAEEVALAKLSYLTIAGITEAHATRVAGLLTTRYIKTNVSDDIYGTEYGAVLKNIFAIAAGMCHALGYGDNFLAVLMSNAIREMKAFVDAVHPIKRDINESAYLGDLLVTGYSQFSRNRLFGNMIGKGYTVRSAQLEMNMVAEGYYAAECVHIINRAYRVPMPICRAVYAVLYEKNAPATEMKILADRLN